MEKIQFISYSPQQLQGEITPSVKIQLKKSTKHYKSKRQRKCKTTAKTVKIIITVIRQFIVINQIVEPSLLHNSNQEISYFYFTICLLMKILLSRIKKTNNHK